MKTGILKYDAKHDSYFLQSEGKVYTLFCFDTTNFDELLGAELKFLANNAREVEALEESTFGIVDES